MKTYLSEIIVSHGLFILLVVASLVFIRIFVVNLFINRGDRLILAKCGHFTKLKSKIDVGGEEIPVVLGRFKTMPEKCIDCLRKETLGDI